MAQALTLPQYFRFLAAHRASEGFTTAQLQGTRKAFDQVRAGREEIAPQQVGSALALFFGQDAFEKWNHLWQRPPPRNHQRVRMAFVQAMPGELLTIPEDAWSMWVRMEMQDLEAIVRSLMEDQGKLAVTCIGSRPGAGAGTAGTPGPQGATGAPYDAPAPPPPPVGAPLTQPIPDALVASNPLHRDAVWHNGGIPLVVTMLNDGPPEQLQRACSLLQTLSSQREAQMAVAWAGAIPILVQHLNHDLSRDNQTSILQQDGLPRLVALLQGPAAEAKEPALLLLLALSQGHEQQDLGDVG
eukprot:s532_g20.t1